MYWKSPYPPTTSSTTTCSPSESDIASTSSNSTPADFELISWILDVTVKSASDSEILAAIWKGYKEFVESTANKPMPRERRKIGEMCYRCVEMLKSCNYPVDDILCLFAVAAASLTVARNCALEPLQSNNVHEIIQSSLSQVFLAHCWLFDEACPIKEWHDHIFSDYCTHSCLNESVMNVFRAQGWRFQAPAYLVTKYLITLIPRNCRSIIQYRVLSPENQIATGFEPQGEQQHSENRTISKIAYQNNSADYFRPMQQHRSSHNRTFN